VTAPNAARDSAALAAASPTPEEAPTEPAPAVKRSHHPSKSISKPKSTKRRNLKASKTRKRAHAKTIRSAAPPDAE
jgi:hypothetical protein